MQRGQAVASAAPPVFWKLVRLLPARRLVGGGLGGRRVPTRRAPAAVVAVDAEEPVERLRAARAFIPAAWTRVGRMWMGHSLYFELCGSVQAHILQRSEDIQPLPRAAIVPFCTASGTADDIST